MALSGLRKCSSDIQVITKFNVIVTECQGRLIIFTFSHHFKIYYSNQDSSVRMGDTQKSNGRKFQRKKACGHIKNGKILLGGLWQIFSRH